MLDAELPGDLCVQGLLEARGLCYAITQRGRA
jgi:hypothetical protein